MLSRQDLLDLADKAFAFCEQSAGIQLYPYQKEFGLRICQSVLLEDGDEITALFSRQSGKTETVSCVIPALCVLLPTLAGIDSLAEDPRISKYKDGFWVGIFAPNYELAGIMHSRMSARIQSQNMAEILADPEIGLTLGTGRKVLTLPNGSRVDSNSAGPQTAIEGKTYHLIICEETQDIQDYKIRKSIHPMGAATNATIIKIGTPAPRICDFYQACERNRVKDLEAGTNQLQVHFQFDYTVAQTYNPKYEKYIKKEIERLGYESDDFRMSYRLHWILERGLFLTPEVLKEVAVPKKKILRKHRGSDITFQLTAGVVPSDRFTDNQVASIDIGRSSDSTVVTVARVWWDNPVQHGDDTRHHIHIVSWLELQGDDHERQYPQILHFLQKFKIGTVVVDATGRGDPIYDRLRSDLSRQDIQVWPFVFSLATKHQGYTILYQEIFEKRLTYPGGSAAEKLSTWRKFIKQLTNLEKNWKGKYLSVEAPRVKTGKSLEKPHDDYADSLMMLVWLVNRKSWGLESHGSLLNTTEENYDRQRSIFRQRRERSRDRW